MSLSPLIWLDICVDLHITNQPFISGIKTIWHYMQKRVISHIYMLLVITNSYPVIHKAHLMMENYALYMKSSHFFRLVRSWTLEESTTFVFLDHIIPFYVINVILICKDNCSYYRQAKNLLLAANEVYHNKHNHWAQWKDQHITRSIAPKDISNLELLHIWLKEYHLKRAENL